MIKARQRLIAQLKNDAPIELHRAEPGAYITEGCMRALTEQMQPGTGWAFWIEKPMADCDAIGRLRKFTDGVVAPEEPDSDLEVEIYQATPLPPVERQLDYA